MKAKRAIPGTDGATVERGHALSIDRTIREADGTYLGDVIEFRRDRIYPRRWVRSANTSDTVGYTLTEVVQTLRARRNKAG